MLNENQIRNLFHQDIYSYLSNHFKSTAELFEKESEFKLPPQKSNQFISKEFQENLFTFWKEAGLEIRQLQDQKLQKNLEDQDQSNQEDEKKLKAKGKKKNSIKKKL